MADSFVDYIRRKRGYGGAVTPEELKAVQDDLTTYRGYAGAGTDRSLGSDRGVGGGWGSAAAAEAARAGRTGSTAGASSGGSTRSGIGSDYAAGGGNYPTSGGSSYRSGIGSDVVAGGGSYPVGGAFGAGFNPASPAAQYGGPVDTGGRYDPRNTGLSAGYLGGSQGRERRVPTTSFQAVEETTGTYDPDVRGGRFAGNGASVEAARPLRSAAPAGGGAGYGPYGGSGTGSRTARNFSGSGFGGFDSTSSRVMNDLRSDFNLTREQAAGVVGNLAHESGGFTTYQEGKPLSGRGGAGWAQWTGSRRNAFESWSKENGLDTRSYAANYGFLKHELSSDYKGTIASLRKTQTPEQAMLAFEQGFEKAHKDYKHYGSRLKYANAAYKGAPFEGTVPGGDADLRKLQTSLNERGANIIVDGIMGPQTRQAMKQYQMGGPAYGTTPPSAFPGVSSGTRAMYTGGGGGGMGRSFGGGGSVGSRIGGGSGYGGGAIGQGIGGAINPNK